MPDWDIWRDFFLAAFDAQPVSRPTRHPESLTVEQAYEVQRRVIAAREERGERAVGYKVGCTSRAIRQQFGISEPICGRLVEPHLLDGDAQLDWKRFNHCAIEPEFVVRMSGDVNEKVDAPEELMSRIEFVAPGIEVHQFKFWFGKPTVQELICRNGIHACQVVGQNRVAPDSFDWELEGVGVFKNGKLQTSGIGAETMGSPLRSLAWLANLLIERGQPLRAGDWVIPGSPVPLVYVDADDQIEARFTNLGTCRATFTA